MIVVVEGPMFAPSHEGSLPTREKKDHRMSSKMFGFGGHHHTAGIQKFASIFY